ncbi:alpha-(1-_3)-arabinofuranosyltransferase domain-containing protein [Knoellia koreensis]|uniref:DUF3367 domain-containing protein n=1 Tax=Knoellia koreensis TaxID=2730921 RepID=A0A849HF18_9MICO|nr:DUF3367 domain-containing protein [Knoellia sp. DB2414S]
MTSSTHRDDRLVWRVRLLAASLFLAALMFHQAPGRVVPDTKLDLTADPGGFLARALSIWDPQGQFGQLQNQAYGYLFPVGPFHWALMEAGAPAWVTQRLWWSVVAVVAFLGMWLLSGALGVADRGPRFVGALLFALSPRIVSELAITSVEVWPYAMAPWVLLPLVVPGRRSWWWRVTASAVAFTFVGGVNAVATGATLVLPALWLLTRHWSVRHALRSIGWLVAIVLVSLWWSVPLVLLGRYSPPFLDWIENAPVTTHFASPWEALRGTTTWLSYLSVSNGPSWPAGWAFVTQGVMVAVTAAVVALGVAGLAARSCPERRFLLLALVTGLALVTLGHVGAAGGLGASTTQALLDGALSPLRNTHKFEPVVRVALVLGACHALSVLQARLQRWATPTWLGPVLVGSLVVALVAPGVQGVMPRPESYRAIPSYWTETASWLDRQPGPGGVLVVPAASFADFTWGSTKDEPLQALLRRPFAVRDAVPLGSAGATRLLDEVQRQLGSGKGTPQLTWMLRSAGVRFVVVRNDLRTDVVPNIGLQVHQALADAGLARVRTFGPVIDTTAQEPAETRDAFTRLPYPSVEVYDTGGPVGGTQVDSSRVVGVAGGPEDMARSVEAVGADAAVSAADAGPSGFEPSTWAVTDGNRRREVFFGRASDNISATLAAGDRGRTRRSVIDYEAPPMTPQSVRRWDGDLLDVRVSSSASDANATLRIGPGAGPAAAVDGDADTAWVSGRFGVARGEWLELSFRSPRPVTGMTVRLSQPQQVGAPPSRVNVTTDGGSVSSVLSRSTEPQQVATPSTPTSRVRITITQVQNTGPENGVAIGEVSIPGAVLGSSVGVNGGSLPADESPYYVLGTPTSGSAACIRVAERPLCSDALSRPAEESNGLRREIEVVRSENVRASGTAVVRPGPAADRLVDDLMPYRAKASSRAVPDLAGRPGAAVDGSLETGWVAGKDDPDPTLEVVLPERAPTRGAQFQVDEFLAASRPDEVEVSLDDGRRRRLTVDAEGRVSWPETRAKVVSFRFLRTSEKRSVDAAGLVSVLPVGVSELVIAGAPKASSPPRTAATGATCGFGPGLTVNGRRLDTQVDGTVGELLDGRPMAWRVCGNGDLSLPAGVAVLDAPATEAFRPDSLVLRPAAAGTTSAGAGQGAALDQRWKSATQFDLRVQPREETSLIVLPQNFSPGWRATTDAGKALTPIRVNGWQQGWVVPQATSGHVTMTFPAQGWFRFGLVAGAAAVLLTAAVMYLTRRRRPTVATTEPTAAGWVTGLALALVVLGFGTVGAAAALAGLVVAGVMRSRMQAVPLVAGGLILVAGAWAVTGLWPTGGAGVTSSAVQLFALTAVAVAVAAGSSAWGGTGSPRLARRIRGRSSQ